MNCTDIDDIDRRASVLQISTLLIKYAVELYALLTGCIRPIPPALKGTKREILSAMHVKELIQSNHSER